MVLGFYGLREEPFGMTPDPRYLYLSPTHREALASLLYGITGGRGFVTLIAKPGMGKTTLVFQLLQRLEESARTVFISQAHGNTRDFMRSLLADLGVADRGGDLVWMHARLNKLLLRQSLLGKRLIVVVDEAQNLDDSVLEALRMLSNFENPREKLIQIVLAGQPQLAEKLASPALVQLRQRISILSRLEPFTPSETARYIESRLRVAGYEFDVPLFTSRALALIANSSEGIPRNINNICFNALSLGCALQRKTIDPQIILEVLHDLDIETLKAKDGVISHSSKERICLPAQGEPRKFSFRSLLPIFATLSLLLALGWPVIKSTSAVTSILAPKISSGAKALGRPLQYLGKPNIPMKSSTPLEMKTNVDAAKRGAASQSLARPVAMEKEEVPITLPITVQRGQSLYTISETYVGKYNGDVLAKILELNPWIHDPQHIEPGDRIRVPSRATNSRDVRRGAAHTSDVLAVEVQEP
jgi:type II secretory pathway predicted ATPase ExeA